jgi:YD repeat-containing protein
MSFPIVEADLVTKHCYSELGDLFRTILPRGNVIEHGYDAAGRLTSIERKAELMTSDDCDTVLARPAIESPKSFRSGTWMPETGRPNRRRASNTRPAASSTRSSIRMAR